MSSSQSVSSHSHRAATLKLSRTAEGQVLTASLPGSFSRADFAKVATHAYDLISKLTGHPCISGPIKFVVDDPVISEIMQVELEKAI